MLVKSAISASDQGVEQLHVCAKRSQDERHEDRTEPSQHSLQAGVIWLAVQAYFSARLSVPIDYNIVFSRKRYRGGGTGKNDGVEEGVKDE